MMNGDFSRKQQTMLAGSFFLAFAASSALAADLNGVTVVPDRDVAARTNMTRTPSDTSALGVTFDADVAKRTNMQRQPTNVAPVKVIQDQAVVERTNMGDVARNKSALQPPKEAASSQPGSTANPIR
jgi:hypothetical protein